MSSFSKDNQKLHVSLISQFITQHLSPAIGLFVLVRLILFISNPLWLISSVSEGIRCMLINSWKGFFSTGSSFLGFVVGLSGVSISFFITILEAELLSELPLFISILITFSDLGSFIFSEFDLVVLSDISLSKPNQKPSIIESFLIDEKRITLKLIISRVLQRLNGQKLIGVN